MGRSSWVLFRWKVFGGTTCGHLSLQVIFTARVAKRAKVMFLQACVTHSVQRRGEVGNINGQPPPPQLGLGHSTPPPHLGLGHSTPPPHLGLGHYTPPPGTWSLHPPPQDYTQAGGTHPTGMHSCLYLFHNSLILCRRSKHHSILIKIMLSCVKQSVHFVMNKL